MALYGGIEAGGTKFVCAVGSGPDDIRDEIRFPTTAPDETLALAIDFFRGHAEKEAMAAVGVACFGPVDPNPASPTFGYVTTTPKPYWAHTDVVGRLRAALHVPIGFDTDVNGAALGEHRWGAAQGLDTFVYLTIGTGLGGGGMVNGRMLHGLMHPEMGHMRVPHDLGARPLWRQLSLSRRLLGRAGLRAGHRGALADIRSRPGARSPGVGVGGALPGAGRDEHHAHAVAATHHHGRRRHGPAADLPHAAQGSPGTAQRLHPEGRDPGTYRRLHRAAGLGNRAGVLGAIALAMNAAEA